MFHLVFHYYKQYCSELLLSMSFHMHRFLQVDLLVQLLCVLHNMDNMDKYWQIIFHRDYTNLLPLPVHVLPRIDGDDDYYDDNDSI